MPPLINTTGGAPSLSSSATKPRPSWAFTPITSNALAEMNPPGYDSGSGSSPLMIIVPFCTRVRPENVRLAARQSSKS